MAFLNLPPVNSVRCRDWVELLDELSIGAFTVDSRHRVTSMNYTAQALMGMKVLRESVKSWAAAVMYRGLRSSSIRLPPVNGWRPFGAKFLQHVLTLIR